ncbi:hypothetical protein DIPPA_10424 [Diplonema papillatum]|nr:hypothetical protein DIPPA_10424 [Diplonema papillatum]
MAPAVKDLGLLTDAEFADQVLSWDGKNVIDVGCSEGSFTKLLVARGAKVIGVEPDKTAMAANLAAPQVPNLSFVEAGADKLPVADASMDIVVFKFSLHHVPADLHAAAFQEASRVLNPGGALLVLEPVAEGNFHYVMSPFHDEEAVRRTAQESLVRHAEPLFEPQQVFRYETRRGFASYDAFVDFFRSKLSFNHFTIEDVMNEETKKRFHEHEPTDGTVVLTQPVKADLYAKKA